ncbi:uncharacterized protein LOC112095739 [Citrus clementina]|uniref:uncharacterized protein LOC112095739 n=1 Tax=Citrus clementina TaxID=85681 RepID=UPI000CED7267|nr:uncharacterized protein LOC112095739 [Citrus x clementina]
MDNSMIDAASGGALVDKTPEAARNLIANMTANSQQFNTRNDLLPPPKRVNEVSTTFLEQQVSNLTSLVQQLALGQHVRPCGVCFMVEHTTDMFPTLQEGSHEQANAVEGFLGQPRQRIEARTSRKLHFQLKINSKENASAMSLRSGKQLEPLLAKPSKVSTTSSHSVTNPSPESFPLARKDDSHSTLPVDPSGRVNISLLDAVKQVPRYAKFLKELCSNKRKFSGNEKVSVGENVYAVLQRKLPSKCKDPCPIEETCIIIQLADRSNAYPKGVVEDVLVQVNELVFPADFYILEMEDESSPNPTLILLGRPFLKTDFFDLSGNDSFEIAIRKYLTKDDSKEQENLIKLDDEVEEAMAILDKAISLRTNGYNGKHVMAWAVLALNLILSMQGFKSRN